MTCLLTGDQICFAFMGPLNKMEHLIIMKPIIRENYKFILFIVHNEFIIHNVNPEYIVPFFEQDMNSRKSKFGN